MEEEHVKIRFNNPVSIQTDHSPSLLKIVPPDTFQHTELLAKESGNFIERKITAAYGTVWRR